MHALKLLAVVCSLLLPIYLYYSFLHIKNDYTFIIRNYTKYWIKFDPNNQCSNISANIKIIATTYTGTTTNTESIM